ncbi:ROK family protein [Pararhodonellum marinum]|uniref:ROK family protein n=1 Tax=Pararhodonellum marinum TaxID=2755358 RepID=UPI001890195A|nr:ROK family protein [Pararhodonellum marinum]
MTKLAIGIDIGGTMTKIGLVHLDQVRVLEIFLTSTEKVDANSFISNLSQGIGTLREKAKNVFHADVVGIGIGVSGFVFENGLVDTTYGFQQFMEDYPLAVIIQKLTGLTCKVDNDARLVVLGEALAGKGVGFERVMGLTLGTGLGIGFVNRGKLYDELPFAHMAGHMTIKENGEKCYCSKTGCLESLVSASGLMAKADSLNWFTQNPQYHNELKSLFEAAQSGNVPARQIIEELIQNLKIGISNFINIYAPEMIVLGGGMSKSLHPYLPQISQIKDLAPFKNYKVQISCSDLGEKAGVIGAAALFKN